MSIDDPLTRGRKNPKEAPAPIGNTSPTPGAMPASKASSQACGTGSQGGSGVGQGAQNDNALNTALDPQLKSAYIAAKEKWEAANPGLKVYAFSGVAARPANPNSEHPAGKAIDVAIYGTDGKIFNNLYNGDTPAFRAYESFASAMGESYTGSGLKWGGNFGGRWYHDSMHFDIGGGGTSRGNVFQGIKNPSIERNSDPSKGIKYDGPLDAASANAGGASNSNAKGLGSASDAGLDATGNNANAVCGAPGSSGCQPISAGVGAVASSLSQGAGLGVPTDIMGAIQGIGGSLVGGLQNGIQGALSNALGSATSLLQSGLSNVISQITGPVFAQIQGIGSGILSSLTGVFPSNVAGDVAKGLVTDAVSKTANSIVQSGVSQLGGFANIFSTALSASSGGSNLKQALASSTSQVFGRATDGILASGNIPGYDTSVITASTALTGEDEGVEQYDNIATQQWMPAASKTMSFVRPLEEVLETSVNSDKINGFGSLFKDYNSMVTQGFGNLTDHLLALGADLTNLGSLGDMNDLLNIGTGKQLARQLIENGLGIKTGLVQAMSERGLPVTAIQNEESEPYIRQILAGINDPDVIDEVKAVFGVSSTLNIHSLADFLDTNLVLPQSKDFNYFANIRDIGTTLLLCCKSMGNVRTYRDLGNLMVNMETAETFTELLDEYHVIRYDEAIALQSALPPNSMFSEDGPVIADFIGTAAGYIHTNTLPKMAELIVDIGAATELSKFKTLMTLLQNVLSGSNVVGSTIVIPTTAGYTFGTYTSLDAAALAVKAKIEAELTSIKATVPTTNPTLWAKIVEYEALHTSSAEFLVHEKKMRMAYGIDIGEPTITQHFIGDGTSVTFPLDEIASGTATVYVDGKLVSSRFWTMNAAKTAITLTAVPAIGKEVVISYDTGKLMPQASTTDTWEFSSSIENHALATGYGGPAEFLNRLATNDMDGQRIKAIMIQARNKARFDAVGIGCPGFNRVLNDDDSKEFNFVERTGIWSSDVNRASEIYIQRTQDVDSSRDYVVQRIAENVDKIEADVALLCENVTRQLVFLQNDSIVVSDKLVSIYQNSSDDRIFSTSRPDMIIPFSLSYPTTGYVLGPYSEIMTAMIRAEGMTDTTFNTPLGFDTVHYLDKIGVNIEFLASVIQRTLFVTVANSLGLSEDEVRELFGIFSASKNVLANIVKGL